VGPGETAVGVFLCRAGCPEGPEADKEILTTWLTPAFAAVSIKLDCTSAIDASAEEMSTAWRTSLRAGPRVSGRPGSPVTTWTPGTEAIQRPDRDLPAG
jgi:hypothetical protein